MTVVENRAETTRGGVTGRGFLPGQSGNPGGRPKGLARRVRELVGEDGHEIVEFMFEVMGNASVRMADRLEAAEWLANRGFGKAELAVNIDLAQHPCLDLSTVSTPDLEALIGIAQRAGLNAGEVVASGELRVNAGQAEMPRSSPH